jgi:ribosomal protein L16 Arg81 hydroxylase
MGMAQQTRWVLLMKKVEKKKTEVENLMLGHLLSARLSRMRVRHVIIIFLAVPLTLY